MFGQLLYHYTQHYYIDEEQVIYNTLLQGAIWFVVLIILCVLAAVAGQIFLALAVYQNAKSRGNANPGMWGVLTGFFGWIPAVIYLATRDYRRVSPKEMHRKQAFRNAMNRGPGRGPGSGRGYGPGNGRPGSGPIARHKCAICGRTELTNPELEFRFCSKCNGNYEYCQDHLFTHTHVK